LAKNTVDVVLSHDHALKTLIDVSSFEYYTQTHSVDVAVYAVAFAHHLGFGRSDLERLSYSAMLHDIGKSRIDKAIIYKAGELDIREFDHIKRHTSLGYFILKGLLENDRDILNGVRYHHERHDGSGYPERLKGKAIPLFAQIISLCDVFSALSTKRIYKDARSSLEALHILQHELHSTFDKTLLDTFVTFMIPHVPHD
jgi:putative nucleotidyltransferase with HDIG domain